MSSPVVIRPLDLDDPAEVGRARGILEEYLEATAVETLEAGDAAVGTTLAEAHAFLHGIMPDVTDPAAAYGAAGCVLLVAERTSGDAECVGCVGITPVDAAHVHPEAAQEMDLDTTCEMNRLFVAPSLRGTGVARRLIDSSREWSHSQGYRRMILDVVPYRTGAIALYRSAGFRDGAAVVDHPICTVSLECDL